jgi:hypothetical protein
MTKARIPLPLLLATLITWLGSMSIATAQWQWGRDLNGVNTFTIHVIGGSVFDLEGEIQETSRPIEEIGGPTSGAPPEDYKWSELGFDDAFAAYGFGLEKTWSLFTFQSRFLTGNPSANSVADRDYYIGVGSVDFRGREYEYMKIPAGQAFTGDITLYTIDARLLFTPFSLGSATNVSFTPSLHVGLSAFIADYEIDAGPAQSVTQYENPPRDYVIGGRGTGITGLGIPELGIGAELRLSLGDNAALIVQGDASFLELSGNSSDLGVNSRNEKALSVSHLALGAKATLEIGLNDGMDLVVGAEYRTLSGDADVRATDKSEEEILTLREKFDKEAAFDVSSLTAFVGLRF